MLLPRFWLISRIWSWLTSRIRSRAGRRRARRAAQARSRLFAHPLLEHLEVRLAPANVSWTGNAGTLNWSDANNWSNGGLIGVPTSADDVTISKVGIGTISISGSAYAVRSLNDTTGSLSIASGASLSLTAVNANSTFGQNVCS